MKLKVSSKEAEFIAERLYLQSIGKIRPKKSDSSSRDKNKKFPKNQVQKKSKNINPTFLVPQKVEEEADVSKLETQTFQQQTFEDIKPKRIKQKPKSPQRKLTLSSSLKRILPKSPNKLPISPKKPTKHSFEKNQEVSHIDFLNLELPDGQLSGYDERLTSRSRFNIENMTTIDPIKIIHPPSESLFSNKLMFEEPDSIQRKVHDLVSIPRELISQLQQSMADSPAENIDITTLISELKST